jgi:hypothetical protein
MFYIKCEPIPGRGKYRLCESVIIEGIKIPAGFEWNGASIPPVAQPLVGSPFDAELMAPSLVHDYAYQTGVISRGKADELFRKLLIHNGVSKERAKLMYKAVHYFGANYYLV